MDQSIQYTSDFKVRDVLENQEGKGSFQIFEEASFDLTVIERVKAKFALGRWRKTYQTYGTEGLLTDRRGKSIAGGCTKQEDSIERSLTKAEARIKYLTTENELLKKLEGLEA